MDLNNIVGFKAVDKNGNERQVTVDEMTELVSARIVSAASEISTFAAAAAAGTDEFEDQLPQSDTFSWLRTLDGSKNPTLTSSSAAAKVLGGLLPIANDERDGLISKNWFISREVLNIESYEDTTILDDLEKCGFYSIVPEIGSWGTLLIFYNGSGGRGGCVQILCTIDDITPNYQIRMKRGNDARNWTSWKKIVIE